MNRARNHRALHALWLALISTFALAQTPDTRTAPTNPTCDRCISKVLQLPSTATPLEIQEVVNLFRTVAEVRILYPDVAKHAIFITAPAGQLAIAEKLLAVLDSVRSSQSTATSIVVHEPSQATEVPGDANLSKIERDLAASYIKALYRPSSSPQQMSDLVKALHNSARIVRLQALPSAHVIVVRGTAEQIAQAESLTKD